MSAASALAFVLSFQPHGLWPLMPVSIALVVLTAVAAPSKRVLIAVLAIPWLLAWAWIQRWILDISNLGMPLFAFYLMGFTLFSALGVRLLARHGMTARWTFAAILPWGWIGLEAVRSRIVFDGYPWYLTAHPMIDAPILVQSADLLGVPFVGSIVALVSGVAVDMLLRRGTRRARAVGGIAALAVVAAALGYGAFRMGETAPLSPGPRILAIQTNLPQSNKIAWSLEEKRRDVAGFMVQTNEAFARAVEAKRTPDLVAWPETMLPSLGIDAETLRLLDSFGVRAPIEFALLAVEAMMRFERPFLVGSSAVDGLALEVVPAAGNEPERRRLAWTTQYNSAHLISPGRGVSRYDKVVLTPFGETMPYISAWPWLESRLLDLGARGMSFDLASGRGQSVLTSPWASGSRDFHFAAPICFEDTVAWHCRRLAHADGEKAIDLFINLSNDGWFAHHAGGRLQHAQIARFRTIENRVPMVRVVNTGVSLSIDSCGRIVDRLAGQSGGQIGAQTGSTSGYGTEGIAGDLLAETTLDSRRTLYSRVGDLWEYACLALTIVLVAGSIRSRTRRSATPSPS